MIVALQISGALLLVLAAVHVGFPWYFRWREELPRISLINAEMLKIHTLFVALAVAGIGWVSVFHARDLVETPFGKTVCTGIALFWTVRLGVQFFGYSSELWRGKRFETVMHVVFIVWWTWLTGLYWVVGAR